MTGAGASITRGDGAVVVEVTADSFVSMVTHALEAVKEKETWGFTPFLARLPHILARIVIAA